jgi:DNA repair protein RecN (Recombination protein N)
VLLEEYAVVFREFSELSRRIKKLQADESMKADKTALLKEKIEDVNAYKLTAGEEAKVTEKLTAARNSKAIRQGLGNVRACLSADSVREARASLKEIAQFLPDGEEILKRVESLEIELDDVRRDIFAWEDQDYDDKQVSKLEERMSDLLRLKRKYKLGIDELIGEHEAWRDELAELEYSEDMTEKLLTERKNIGDNLKKLAGEITAKRKAAADELAARITDELTELNMPSVRLFFDIRQEKVTVSGMDGVEIMISVNKGEEPKPLAKIASGGELSRIMLAIKAVLGETSSTPTMIFDEIDTGISGRAAQKVGAKLAAIAEKRQVLCVTHLASIAAKADRHLLIEKTSDDTRTFTHVRELDSEQRKQELTRIVSGDEEELTIKIG